MDDWEQSQQHQETWDSFPSCQVPVMQNAAYPVTTKVPPGYDGTASGSSAPMLLKSGVTLTW